MAVCVWKGFWEDDRGRRALVEDESPRSSDIAEGIENVFLEEDPGRETGVLLPRSRSRDIAVGMADREDGLGMVSHRWRDGGATGGNAPVGEAGGASLRPLVGVGSLGGRSDMSRGDDC